MQIETEIGEVEHDILEIASDGKEHRFKDFQKELVREIKDEGTRKGKYAKGTIIKYLNRLIDEELIEVKLSSKEQGYRRVYYATEKGQLAVLTDNTEHIRKNLGTLEKLTASLLLKPEILDEWRATTRTVIRGIATNEKMSLEEKARLITKERTAQFDDLRKVLRNMHQISLILFASTPENKAAASNFYLHINENGVIDILSEFETIKHSDIKVISM